MRWAQSIFLVLALLSFAPLTEAARLGIVQSGENTAPAADLLTASLSKKIGIQLVERAELERIAKERGLPLTRAAETGKLVGADALIFLESSGAGTNQTATLRTVGVRQGAILYSTSLKWPPQALDEWAEKIADKLALAAAKSTIDPDAAIKVSVLNLRSAINSPAQQLLERELTSALLVRLAQEPQIFVLERRQLGAAVFEKELAASEEKFWTGSHLLDGTINRDSFDPKRVTVSARLRSPDGKEAVLEAAGARDQVSKVVEDLVAKILAALKIQSRAGWDAAREASQHLAEAKWAERWKMWKEAQAAADSAWALGEQSLDAATTRLVAYGRDDLPYTEYWHVQIEERMRWPSNPPPPSAVESPYQAMALIQETLARHPGAVSDKDWWAAAREAIDRAGQILDYFFWSAEARPPVQEKLADLRALCRDVMKTLMNHPTLRKDYWIAPEDLRSPDEFETNFGRGEDIFSIYLRRSALFNEKPEDTLAVIRELMAGDPYPYLRHQLLKQERMISPLGGWKWADRKRELSVWNKFVEEQLQSTNVLTQLEGRLMKWASMPDRDTSGLGDALTPKVKEEILGFIAENKSAILEAKSKRLLGRFDSYGRLGHVLLSRETSELDDQFYRSYERRKASKKAENDLAELRKRIAEKQPYDFSFFARLVGLNVSTNQAADLLAAVKEYRTQVAENLPQRSRQQALGFLPHVERQLATKAGLPTDPPVVPSVRSTQSVVNPPLPAFLTNRFAGMSNRLGGMGGRFGFFGESNLPPVETIVAPTALKVDRFWSAPPQSQSSRGFNPFDESANPPLWREGKLWLRLDAEVEDPIHPRQRRSQIIAIDSASWKVQSFPLEFDPKGPPIFGRRGSPRRPLEILNGAIFVTTDTGLLRKRKGLTKWEEIPSPSADVRLWHVGTNLYLLSDESLHLLNPEDGRSRALVSTRRRPTLTPVDEEDSLQGAGLMQGPNGTLRILVRRTCFAFDGANWKREFALTNADWTVNGDAAFAVSRDPYRANDLFALKSSDEKPTLVAKAMSPQPGLMAPAHSTNWNFTHLTILAGQPFLFGTNVAVIIARGRPWTVRMEQQREPTTYDLFVFGQAGPKPVQIQFEVDVSEVMGTTQNVKFQEFAPWALATENDLLFGHSAHPGFWRVARAEIQSAIDTALQQTQPESKR